MILPSSLSVALPHNPSSAGRPLIHSSPAQTAFASPPRAPYRVPQPVLNVSSKSSWAIVIARTVPQAQIRFVASPVCISLCARSTGRSQSRRRYPIVFSVSSILASQSGTKLRNTDLNQKSM